MKKYKIYYINLKHREDRLEDIEKSLDECGLLDLSERFEAVEVKENGVLGCVLSHIGVIKKFINSDEEYAIIIEDDLFIKETSTFKGIIDNFFEQEIDFDVTQISGNHLNTKETKYGFLHKVIDSQTTSGYILSRKFSQTLLDNFEESCDLMKKYGKNYDYCLDIYWKKLQPNNNWFCFMPPLAYQKAGYSDIENKNVDYGV